MAERKDKRPLTTDELRQKAEAQLSAKMEAEKLSPRTHDEMARLLHELEVHQIELEMQNAELRQARDDEEGLREKLTDLYEFSPVGYVNLDRAGAILAANLTTASLLDIVRSSLLGRRFSLLIDDQYRPVFTNFLDRAFASQTKESCELKLSQGAQLPLFVSIEAITDASGQECRAAIIDISARRVVEEKLNLLHAALIEHAHRLDAKNIELDAFNYTVSHDLKSPLVTILGFIGKLEHDLEQHDREGIKADFDFIKEAAQKMRHLLDSLLKLSRAGKTIGIKQSVNLAELVDQTIIFLGERLSHVKLQVNIPADFPRIMCDQERMGQVMQNLLENAAKFTAGEAEVQIEVGAKVADGKIVCFVRDNGIGIPVEYQEKVFGLFERLDPSIEGTGTGLAIVQRIIEKHGGRAWVESEGEGSGSTFFFTLPTD